MPLVASREINVAGEELVVVRTSDRMLFKKCRRLWGWTSHMKMGLTIKEQADYFWFGTGLHYALEDYHGANVYGHPGRAFQAYTAATRIAGCAPATWNDLLPTGLGIMCYYADYWLKSRDPFGTFVFEGQPQLEAHGYIDLGAKKDGRRVVYGFTIDRMIEDEHGQIWVGEYKSAKAFRTFHYDTDEQCTAYCWAANRLYRRDIAGVYYYQFKKTVPQLPKILAAGGISTDPRQPTTGALYRKQLLDVYGDLKICPPKNIKMLNELVTEETEDQDRFIRREAIERNQDQIDNFERRVILELEDMLNDDLPLYPNQTKDCSWSCPLQAACIAMESGGDYEQALSSYARHPGGDNREGWRKSLPHPANVAMPEEAELYQGLIQEVQRSEADNNWEPQITPEEAFLAEFQN